MQKQQQKQSGQKEWIFSFSKSKYLAEKEQRLKYLPNLCINSSY
jgi:hypothetical protein